MNTYKSLQTITQQLSYFTHYLIIRIQRYQPNKDILQSNFLAKNSPSRAKNSDELNVNPLTTKQNQKSSTSDNNESLSSDAMREYTCDKCGKSFLTRDDLHVHKKFEG